MAAEQTDKQTGLPPSPSSDLLAAARACESEAEDLERYMREDGTATMGEMRHCNAMREALKKAAVYLTGRAANDKAER